MNTAAQGNIQEMVQKQQGGIQANSTEQICSVIYALAVMTYSRSSSIFNVFNSVRQFPVKSVTYHGERKKKNPTNMQRIS